MFVKATEGDTEATIHDREFFRKAQPPSDAQLQKRAGIPAPPVASINRPQMFTNPRAWNPTAAADLKGQSGLTLALSKLAANQAKIIAREKKAETTVEKKILSTAIATIQRNRTRQGLGEQPLLTTEPVNIEMVKPLDPVAIAQKVAAGGKLTQQEFAVWEAQSPLARGVWTVLPQLEPGTKAGDIWASIQTWLQSETLPGVKNMYLAGGAALFAVILSTRKRGRR